MAAAAPVPGVTSGSRAAAAACADWTAAGERRLRIAASTHTLRINTGTLCNVACRNGNIQSRPQIDRLVFLSAAEVAAIFLDEIDARRSCSWSRLRSGRVFPS